MLVTAIIPQKKDPAKRNIFIDGEFAFSLIAQDVLYFNCLLYTSDAADEL